ncbi:MAG: PAS domain S-box protein [Bacteroidetes bacterium]|nr:PAS domain S-box protein [Bacteroidota bacterium]
MYASGPHEALEALFNNAAIGIIIVNTNGEIILVNKYALNQFGYTEAELIGNKIELLVPSRFQSKHSQHRSNYHTHAHNRPMGTGMDLYGVKKDQTEFPVEVSLSAYKTKDGDFAVAFVSDISKRKASEDALLKLNAELEEKVADRTRSLTEALIKEVELNELKTKFVSMASHEFRTPLSTIQSSAYLISQYAQAEDQPKRDKHIQRIASSVTMLTDILNDFLSVGKIEEGKVQVRITEFSIEQCIHDIIEEMNTIIKKGQTIIYKHTGNENVVLDNTLFKHIIINLLSNAIKFSPESSEIVINTEIKDDLYIISVTDSGIGISEEDREHLFERFYRGNNVSNIQGTGLGLHIVAKYTELMMGTIECKSEINKGAAFIVHFKPDANYEKNLIH